MQIILPHQPVPPDLKNAVVAIGNFDGAHIGHQVLFEMSRKRALDLNAPFVILTFNPHPRTFFRPDSAPFLITSHALKMDRLAKSGAHGCVIIHFDADLANQTPDAFIETILKTHVNAAHIFVGADFHFGHNRLGNAQTIRDARIPVTTIDPMTDHTGAPYASTRIRAALQGGHIQEANRLLGWTWEIHGVVGHGDKRGRQIGYPTANVPMRDTIAPAYGIYAGWVRVDGDPTGTWHKTALSLGKRPMFAVDHVLLEAYLLDFNGDLYDRTLHIRLVKRLRDEMTFETLEALIVQIGADCAAARDILDTP